MFGAGVTGTQEATPKWIREVVREVESMYGFTLRGGVYFKEPTRNKDYWGGCFSPSIDAIQLYFCAEKTDHRLWIVLHELAHAIQHIAMPETLTPMKPGRMNRVVHNKRFFQIAREMYIKFGVLEEARKHEYKRARKLMVE